MSTTKKIPAPTGSPSHPHSRPFPPRIPKKRRSGVATAAFSLILATATTLAFAKSLPSIHLGAKPEPLFLVDDSAKPRGSIAWPTRDGAEKSIDFELEYRSPNERTPIGANLDAFAAVGGTRQDKGASHPRGASIRVGFYKLDMGKPLFEDIKDRASITVTLRNIRFNQPGYPRPRTILQHLKYNPEDLVACGLGLNALDQYNTSHDEETLHGVITTANGRLGSLDATKPGGGSSTLTLEPDGTITLITTIPYALFRHVRDPWQRTSPRTFFEPNHFHIEYEAVPRSVALGFASMGEDIPGLETPTELK